MKQVLIIANHIDWLYSLRQELIEELNEYYRVVISIPTAENSYKVDYFKNMGVSFRFSDYRGRSKNIFENISLFSNYYKLIKDVDPDIVLTYTIKPNIYGTLASKLLSKKTIINITGLGSGFYDKGITGRIVKTLYTFAGKSCDYAFFQNESNMNLFIEQEMVNKEKTKLIPGSGVNITKFHPEAKTNSDTIVKFLFIGRIMKEKGIEEYLEVAKRLTERYANIEFQILGSFEEGRYKDIILENENPQIRYLGRSDDVRNEIREVDCIIHPSYHEGMSNVLLEGGAMGKPLLASNIPGCKEIIEDGYNGYLFDVKSVDSMEEKIIQFLKLDKKTRETMGRNSRKKIVEEFDRNIVINEYMKAIASILKRRCK